MSTPASNQVQTAGAAATAASAPATPATVTFPAPQTLIHAAKFALEHDRAIMLDYFRETGTGHAFLGEDSQTGDRVLIKSKEEFTSLIKKVLKTGEDIIVFTENSIYIVSGKIQKKKVNLAALQEAYDSSI